MSRFWLSAALLCLLLAPAQAQNQNELNQQAAEDHAKADRELNQVYDQLLHRLDKPSKDKLVTAELDWIKFRDSQAAAEAEVWAGGSMQPMILEACKARVTRARTAELKRWLQDLDNS